MPVTVNINGLSSLHQTSGGVATATLPDVCRTPYGGTPIPYPNIALSSDLAAGTVTVAIDGSSAAIQTSIFAKSTGDEAGALGGVVSQVFMLEASFLSASPTVFIEGVPACRLTDKTLMNKANTVCMDGVVNPPVVPPDTGPMSSIEALDPGEPVFCEIESLMVGCKHGEHPSTDLIWNGQPLLQVIATKEKPDTINTSLIGNCGAGNPMCPALYLVELPEGEWTRVPDGGSFEAKAPASGIKNIYALLVWIVGAGEFPRRRYMLRPLICNSHDEIDVAVGAWLTIEAFEETKLGGSLSLSYGHPRIEKPSEKDKNDGLIYERLSTWTFSGELEGTISGQKLPKLEKSTAMKGSDPFPGFSNLLDLVGKTTMIFESMQLFGAKPKGGIIDPKWTFGAVDIALGELPASPLVGLTGSLSVKFDPLIGYGLTVSLLDYLIIFAGSLAPGPGNLLARALIYIKDNFKPDSEERSKQGKLASASLDVEIELKVEGRLDASLETTFTAGGESLEVKATGHIDVQLEGRLMGRAKVWRVEFAGGGKMGLAAAEGDGKKPVEFGITWSAKSEKRKKRGRFVPDGGPYFSGLAFYYLFYFELGAVGAESEKKADVKEKSPGRGRIARADDPPATTDAAPAAKDPPKVTKLKRAETKGSCVLIDPWKWNYQQA